MSETASWEATPDEIKQYRAEIDRYVADMEAMQQQMAANRNRIKKNRAQTQAILSELRQLQQTK